MAFPPLIYKTRTTSERIVVVNPRQSSGKDSALVIATPDAHERDDAEYSLARPLASRLATGPSDVQASPKSARPSSPQVDHPLPGSGRAG